MKYYYDKNRKEQSFEVGEQVLLGTRNLKIHHTGYAKNFTLEPRFIGPYKVIKKCDIDSYEISLPTGIKIHPVFHTSQLKKFHVDSRNCRRNSTSKTILYDGAEGQLVEKVLDYRNTNDLQEYLIKRRGEPLDEASWEPIEKFETS